MQVNKIHNLSPSPDQEDVWNELFLEDNIRNVFYENIHPRGGQGVDRISVIQFEKNLDREIEIIRRKSIQGTYSFSPYLEQLQSKGKNKYPRIISIPTVRDKIVLKIITNFLHIVFDDYVGKDLPNTVVKKINSFTSKTSKYDLIKLDIKGFYPSVTHEKLFSSLSKRITHKEALKIIKRAISNPTLEQGYSAEQRKETAKSGIPQGLSISNILAEIYISPLDKTISKKSLGYFRFVDDLLIFSKKENIVEIWGWIEKVTKDLLLEINSEKSTERYESIPQSETFEFLGYHFDAQNNIVSVRPSSADRFINSLTKKIIRYKHSLNETHTVSADIRKSVFIEDLNEIITGAINENRRYGWVFFFSEINDTKLLHKIDMVVEKLILRLPNFSKTDLSKIKSTNRARYEALHSPKRGYIRNYNKFTTKEQKLKYLSDRGLLKDGVQYTDDQIHRLFNKVKTSKLLKLEQDTTNIS